MSAALLSESTPTDQLLFCISGLLWWWTAWERVIGCYPSCTCFHPFNMLQTTNYMFQTTSNWYVAVVWAQAVLCKVHKLHCLNSCSKNRSLLGGQGKQSDYCLLCMGGVLEALVAYSVAYVAATDVAPRCCMLLLQVYDVLKPNKHFSKGRPDDPRLVVCLSTCTFAPSLSVIQHLQQQAHPLPLQFAKVAGGEVSFHGIQNWS